MFQNINLLKNMKVGMKIGLVILSMFIPIASLTFFLLSSEQRSIRFTKTESSGIEYINQVRDLIFDIPSHRDIRLMYLYGGSSKEEIIKDLENDIELVLKNIDLVDTKYGQVLDSANIVQELRKRWDDIKDVKDSTDSQSVIKLYEKVLSHTSLLINHISKKSMLNLDPETNTSILISTIIDSIPMIVHHFEELRKLGINILVHKIITFEDSEKLNNLIAQIELQLKNLEEILFGTNNSRDSINQQVDLEPLLKDTYSSAEKFLKIVRNSIIEDESLAINPEDYFDNGSDVIVKYRVFYNAAIENLRALLKSRVQKATTGRNIQLSIALLLTAVAVTIATLTYRYITRQVSAIINVFSSIDKGDFGARVDVLSKDELGTMSISLNQMLDHTLSLIQSQEERDAIQNSVMKLLDEVSEVAHGDLTVEAEVTEDVTGAIADSFNHMIYQLRHIVANVQNATLQVSTSANQIQSTAEQLAEGSSVQAEQIVDSSAALDEMAVSIQQVSEHATLSASVAEQALANAKQGAVAVQNTIQGMHRIRLQVQETAKRIKRLGERSQEISEIVQLIGDIADRTSILALNASIQAARAGDAGRSFAVVAEEVERLAERSTNATKQIASLVNTIQSETNEAVMAMEESTHEVVQGSQVADQAGQALGEIESVSSRLSALIQSISLAATQQARGSDNLSKAMGEISDITQHTATGTKQAADAISHLATLADELRNSVSTFRLPLGTN